MQNQILNHKLELDGRKRLTLTGVQSVDGFSQQVLNLTVLDGKLKISGENIKITGYNKQTGVLTADGNFTEIKYLEKNKNLFKKLFK